MGEMSDPSGVVMLQGCTFVIAGVGKVLGAKVSVAGGCEIVNGGGGVGCGEGGGGGGEGGGRSGGIIGEGGGGAGGREEGNDEEADSPNAGPDINK